MNDVKDGFEINFCQFQPFFSNFPYLFLFREQRRKQYLKNIESFQHFQAEKKKTDTKEAKLKSDTERRTFVNGLHDDAQAKGYQELLKESKIRKDHGQDLIKMITEKNESKDKYDKVENDLLDLADAQAEGHHKAKIDEKIAKHERILRIGARQHHAAKLYKENVLDKIVDKEDDNIEDFLAKEDNLYWNAMKKHKDKKVDLAKSLNHFHNEDQKIKNQRREVAKTEIVLERENDEQKFETFLKYAQNQDDKRLYKANEIKRFWNDQCNAKKEAKRMQKKAEADYLKAIKYRESVDEDNFEQIAENLISTQQALGRETYPVVKCKAKLALGRGPPLVAADNFGNKIYAVTKDQFYKPIDSRNRLSINWNPDLVYE